MTHVLACALCGSDGGTNAAGTFIAWVFGILIGLCVLAAVIRGVLGVFGVKAVKNDPVTPPWLRELATGYRVPAYTAPVKALTPTGVQVHRARCCQQGHQVPDQAVAHAAQIAAVIAVNGR